MSTEFGNFESQGGYLVILANNPMHSVPMNDRDRPAGSGRHSPFALTQRIPIRQEVVAAALHYMDVSTRIARRNNWSCR
jgi:hypothetical protein